MLREIISRVLEALVAIPGVRFVLGLVDSRLRPLWAAVLIAGLLYLLSRTANYLSLQRARQIALSEDLARKPAVALGRKAEEAVVPEAPAVVTTDVPKPASTRLVTAAIAASIVILLLLSAALRGRSRTPVTTISALDSLAVPAVDTSFTFDDAGWRRDGDACIATMRITALGRHPRRLSLFVMNAAGQVIGRDAIQSPALAVGAMVDFRLRKIDCDDIHEWQVQGEFPTP